MSITAEILTIVAQLPDGNAFTTADILRRLPHLRRQQIKLVLTGKARAGILERTQHGRYRKRTTPMAVSGVAEGAVSEALWNVLKENRNQSLRLTELVVQVTSKLGQPGVSLYHSVSYVLYHWHRHGHLDRIGIRYQYRYRLKPKTIRKPRQCAQT